MCIVGKIVISYLLEFLKSLMVARRILSMVIFSLPLLTTAKLLYGVSKTPNGHVCMTSPFTPPASIWYLGLPTKQAASSLVRRQMALCLFSNSRTTPGHIFFSQLMPKV